MHTRWDPVIKRGGLGSNYQEGGTINWFNTATYFTCPNLGPDIGTSYVVSLVEQELLTLLEHLRSPPIFSEIRVTRSVVLCVCFVDLRLSLCTFSFSFCHCVVCYFLYTDSDWPFGIFKFFLSWEVFVRFVDIGGIDDLHC
jgi:hypothetical protein